MVRDRIASTATTNGHTTTSEGYGVGFGALMPFVDKKLDVSLESLFGQGIGRYGCSGLPDVTINPTTGELRPLREARIMRGLVYHRSSRLDLYTYGGMNTWAGMHLYLTYQDRCGIRLSSCQLHGLHKRSSAECL